MKAKIKPLIILIAILAAALVAFAAGCTIGEQDAKERADALGMTGCVTYYTNGGNFVSGTNTTDPKAYRTDYVYPDTPIFNIGVDETGGQSFTITRTGYVFDGWEYAKLDENGLPVLMELESVKIDENTYIYKQTGNTLTVHDNGSPFIVDANGIELLEQNKKFEAVPTGEKVFANGHPRVGDGEHVYLVATWVADIELEYRLITDAPITETDNNETVTYNNGDKIASRLFKSDTINLNPNVSPKTFSGFTYIHMYWDAEGKEPVENGQTVSKDTETGESPVIYVKYLSGSWTAVKTASQAANMLNATGNANYFVVFDIDCSSATTFSFKTTGTFGGTIEGNGKTLSNINVEQSVKTATGSLFGNLTATAKIKNLTLKNVTMKLTVNGTASTFVLVTSMADGATFENFTLDTVTLNITTGPAGSIYNIQQRNDGSYDTKNWLYGGYTTDAEFESNFGTLVKNATLIMNEEEIVSGGLQ